VRECKRNIKKLKVMSFQTEPLHYVLKKEKEKKEKIKFRFLED
jgi:hypothetical protein